MEMESEAAKNDIWLSSKEAKKVLKVSDCHLMHMRLAGMWLKSFEKLNFNHYRHDFISMLFDPQMNANLYHTPLTQG